MRNINSFFKVSSAVLLGLSLVGCVKHRPVETIKDADNTRILKSPFIAQDGSPKTWLSKVTVVRTSHNTLGSFFVGMQSDTKAGHFEFTKDKLRYLNDVSPYSTRSNSRTAELLNEWSISHTDFKLEEKDGQVTNREVEDEDKTWNNKRYFKIDFAKADITEGATFPYYADMMELACWSKRASSLVDNSLDISDDYISFVVSVDYQLNSLCVQDRRRAVRDDYTATVEFRYSFKRLVETGYQPFVYTGDDDPNLMKFGYFVSYRESIKESNGQYKNTILMNRFDPTKSHRVYFTKDFPQQFKWIYNDPEIGVFARTNQALIKQGLPTRFNIFENTDHDGKVKELGDIRYSFIHYDPELDEDAPLGYGPSDKNPFTGETIASTSVVWTGFLQYYLEIFSRTKGREITKFKDSSLFRKLGESLKEPNPDNWVASMDFSKGAGKTFLDLLPTFTFGNPRYVVFTGHGSPVAGPASVEATPGDFNSAPSLFEFRPAADYERIMPKSDGLSAVLGMRQRGMKTVEKIQRELSNPRNSTIYAMDSAAAAAAALTEEGVKMEDVLNDILYRVSIHEYGHNLGLRHNFYGTNDKPNHGHGSNTSSVMDYLDLASEYKLPRNWEPYDVAALTFGYSSGKADIKGNYLYCSDEQSTVNALCNQFDLGTSPSEIALSLIKLYEDRYYVRNYRNGRAYWDTAAYEGTMFKTMWSMKKFLMLWQTAYSDARIKRELENRGELSKAEMVEVTSELTDEMKRAVKLSLGFFNAVLQQSAADKPWRSEYASDTGYLKRLGIASDKLWAMFFLMGDDTFAYDPNRRISNSSYLSVRNTPELREIVDRIFENSLTERVDMEPWFIGLGRGLYAIQSTDYVNLDDASRVNALRVIPFTRADLVSLFGIDLSDGKQADVVTLSKSGHSEFRLGEKVGYALINDRYYVASASRNPVSFDIILSIREAERFDSSTVQARNDLLEMYNLYMAAIRDDRRN